MRIHVTKSINNVNIRLTNERWKHIVVHHPKMNIIGKKGIIITLEKPREVWQHTQDTSFFVAIGDKPFYFVVYYREIDNEDGFVITAHPINYKKQIRKFMKRNLKKIYP